MKKLSLLFFFVGISLLCQAQKEVLFSTDSNDKLLLSEIAKSSRKISFEPYDSKKLFRISQLIEVGSSIYITEGSDEEEGYPKRVIQYNLEGKFIRVVKSITLGQVYIAQGEGNTIFCSHGRDIACYNEKGELRYQFKPDLPINSFCFFNKRLWYITVLYGHEFMQYSLYSSDATGHDFKMEKKITETNSTGMLISSIGDFSICDNSLYFSMGLENSNTMYHIEKGKVLPYICFNAKNLAKRFDSPPFKKAGQFLFYGFKLDNNSGSVVYNTINDKSVTVSYKMKGNELVDGIMDNVYNTGSFWPNLNSNNNSLFFYEKSNEASKGLTTVYLVKLK